MVGRQVPAAPQRPRRRFADDSDRLAPGNDGDEDGYALGPTAPGVVRYDNGGDDTWYRGSYDNDLASPSLQQGTAFSRQAAEAVQLPFQPDELECLDNSTFQRDDIPAELRQKILAELKLDSGAEAEEVAMSFSIVNDPLLMTWDPILKDFKNKTRGVNLLPKPSTKQEAHLAFTYIMDSLGALVNGLENVTHKAGHEKPVDRLTIEQQRQLSQYVTAGNNTLGL